MKRMIHADERRRFRQPITLNDGVAEPRPKLFGGGRQRGASRNDGPEFPAEAAPDSPKHPPAPQEMFPFRRAKLLTKILDSPAYLQVALDLIAQRLNQSRNRDQDRSFFVADRPRYLCWVQRVDENRSCAQNLWQENAEQLAKDVAQWQQIEETQRVKQLLIAPVVLDLLLDRL